MGTPGRVAKYCSCIDPATGKKIGIKCPQLRRSPGGAWSQHHGSWYMQIELPAAPGQPRRQFRRHGYATRTEAQAILDEARNLLALTPRDPELTLRIAQLLADLPPKLPLPTPEQVIRTLRASKADGVALTVGAYLDDWLSGRTKLSPSARYSYALQIRVHLKPHLGKIALHALRPIHIQDMFTAIQNRNQQILDARQSSDPAVRASVRGKRITGPATQHRIRGCLRKALNDAIRVYKLIEYNPATAVDMPSGARPRAKVWTPKAVEVWRDTGAVPSKVMVWTPAMASQFLDYAEGHDIMLYALFSLVAVWGLRRGEACGLRDIDVDLHADVITIVRQRTTIGYQPVEREVKTRAGERVLAIDTHTADILRTYLKMRDGWQRISKADWPQTGLFFVRPDGIPWHPDGVSYRFQDLVRRAGLPPIRFHDLRHCAASYLKLAGADMKTIQEILGHSSIVITSDTYTSLFADLDRTVTSGAANIIHLNRRKPDGRYAGRRERPRPHTAA